MKRNRKIIYLTGFLFYLSIVLVFYINSSFLETYVGRNYVGAIYIASSIAAILGLSQMPKILNRLGNRKTNALFSLLIFLSLTLLALTKNAYVIIPSFITYFVSVGFVIATLDIFVEDASLKHSIGKMRGLYLMSINSAWVLSQVISGTVIGKIGFTGMYLISAGLIILAVAVSSFFLKNFRDPVYRQISAFKTVRSFIRDKNLGKAYFTNLVLQVFYAFMVIYSPIYLYEHIGFSWSQIGIIFSIMLVPFVLLDFPLGRLSDRMGEKKMLIAGFSVTLLFTFFIPFIEKPVLWVWALALFITRIGAATIEIMSESYFFKIVKERNADEVSFFRNTPSVSYIIAPLLASILLFATSNLGYIFFLLDAILLIGLFIALQLRDVK